MDIWPSIESGYTDYTEALARKGGAVSEGQSTAVGAEKKKSAQADWKQNRPQKLKFTYKEQREFETIDDDIAALEELLEKLDKDMEANATNSVKLREIMEQKEKAQADLDGERWDRWVYLNDLAERIEAQKSEKWFFSDAIDFAEGSLVWYRLWKIAGAALQRGNLRMPGQ